MTLFQIPNNNRHFRWNQCFKLWDAEGLACTVYALRFTDLLRSFLWLLQETGAWGLCKVAGVVESRLSVVLTESVKRDFLQSNLIVMTVWVTQTLERFKNPCCQWREPSLLAPEWLVITCSNRILLFEWSRNSYETWMFTLQPFAP